MKKIYSTVLISILCIFCYSCVTPRYIEDSYLLDYSKYTAEGIYLTEFESVPFEYEPMGNITVSVVSGWVKDITVISKIDSDELYGEKQYNTIKSKNEQYILASKEVILSKAVNEIKKLSANGIINLKITHIIKDKQSGYILTGMAIKR